MKKKLWIAVFSINLLLIAALVALFFLFVAHPFHPWDKYYALQGFVDRVAFNLKSDNTDKAHFAIDLAERRLSDLAMAKSESEIIAAGITYDRAMQEVAASLENADPERIEELYARVRVVLMQTKMVTEKIDPYLEIEVINVLHAKVQISMGQKDQITKAWAAAISPQAIPFLGNDFTAADHTTYPLDGHYDVACLACHVDGRYKGTPTECEDCHTLPQAWPWLESSQNPSSIVAIGFTNDALGEHYAGKCVDCHNTYSWEPIAFDHQYYDGCIDCHADDLPEVYVYDNFSIDLPHYDGECAACHQDVVDWAVAEYPHVAEVSRDCVGCHQKEAPEDHYPDFNCQNCHDANSWAAVTFDHSNMESCITCHLRDKPANHYPGQCSNCHEADSWEYKGHPDNPNCGLCHETDYHKTGSNCTMCHEQTGHYPGVCSDCHSTRDWDPAGYVHRPNGDCASCHEQPQAHYPGSCLQCHSVEVWDNPDIQHNQFDVECIECHSTPDNHYPGLCWQCHDSNAWEEVDVQHASLSLDCETCHVTPDLHYPGECFWCHGDLAWGEVLPNHDLIMGSTAECGACHTIEDHWPGDCSNCHLSYSDWGMYTFDHTGYSLCNSCHTSDRPNDHPRGLCSKCHTTDSWDIDGSTPTPTPMALQASTDTPTPAAVGDTTETPSPRPTSTPTEEVTPTEPFEIQDPTETSAPRVTSTAITEPTDIVEPTATLDPRATEILPTEVEATPTTDPSVIRPTSTPSDGDTSEVIDSDLSAVVDDSAVVAAYPDNLPGGRTVVMTKEAQVAGSLSGDQGSLPGNPSGSALDWMATIYLAAFSVLTLGSIKLCTQPAKHR